MGSYVKDKGEVKGLSTCIFKSKPNDYHPKIIADKEYPVSPSHPRIFIKVKKKFKEKIKKSIWVNCNKKKSKSKNSGALDR